MLECLHDLTGSVPLSRILTELPQSFQTNSVHTEARLRNIQKELQVFESLVEFDDFAEHHLTCANHATPAGIATNFSCSRQRLEEIFAVSQPHVHVHSSLNFNCKFFVRISCLWKLFTLSELDQRPCILSQIFHNSLN